jgi:3-oxoacyl-ACP reductase-like protein
MSASSMGDYSTVPPATVGEPVSITASTPSTSALTAAAIGTAPAPASASAPVPVPAPASQDFEVEYAEKLHIASASSLMRQIASSKQGDNSPEVQQHESEKTNHYSKLGSAFVTSNVLGRGAARGGGRGRGRGL